MDKKKMKVLTIVGAAAVLSVVLLGLYGPRLAEALGNTSQREDLPGTFFGKTVAILGPKSNYTQYCGVKSATDPTVDCDNPEVYDNHLFEIQPTDVACKGSECQITIKNKLTNRYCADEGNRIYCSRTDAAAWEKHGFIKHPEFREFSLLGARSGTARKVCRDDFTTINCTSKTGQYNKEQRFRWVMDSELDRIRNADGTIRPKADAAAANQQTAAKLDAFLNRNNANVATSNVSTTTTTAAAATASIPSIKEGAAIRCDDGTGMIYRYTQGQKRYYPHPDIASAWDPAWNQPQQLTAEQCRGIPTGPVMTKPGDAQPNSATTPAPASATTWTTSAVTTTSLQEGDSIVCNDGTGAMYRFMGGEKRPYPNEEVARAWGYKSPKEVSVEQCRSIPTGPVLTMPWEVQPSSATTPATAPTTSVTTAAATTTPTPATATLAPTPTAAATTTAATTQTNAAATGTQTNAAATGTQTNAEEIFLQGGLADQDRPRPCATARDGRLYCNKNKHGQDRPEVLRVVKNGDKATLYSTNTGKYCTDNGENIICNSDTPVQFQFREFNNNARIAFKGKGGWCVDKTSNIDCSAPEAQPQQARFVMSKPPPHAGPLPSSSTVPLPASATASSAAAEAAAATAAADAKAAADAAAVKAAADAKAAAEAKAAADQAALKAAADAKAAAEAKAAADAAAAKAATAATTTTYYLDNSNTSPPPTTTTWATADVKPQDQSPAAEAASSSRTVTMMAADNTQKGINIGVVLVAIVGVGALVYLVRSDE